MTNQISSIDPGKLDIQGLPELYRKHGFSPSPGISGGNKKCCPLGLWYYDRKRFKTLSTTEAGKELGWSAYQSRSFGGGFDNAFRGLPPARENIFYKRGHEAGKLLRERSSSIGKDPSF